MSELKVGDVLYPRYSGLVIRDGGTLNFREERVTVILVDSLMDNVWTSDQGHYSIVPDRNGLSWKTFYTKE